MGTSNQMKRNIMLIMAMVFAVVSIAFAWPQPAYAATVTGVTGPTTINAGSTGTVTAALVAAATESQAVTWSTSDASVATVISSGLITGTVTAIGAGTVTITATPDAGGAASSITITVPAITLTGIAFNLTSVSVLPGGTASPILTFTPSNATNKNVTWASSDPSIATVNPTTGIITGVSEGTATITATSQQGPHQATIFVYVGSAQAVTGVRLNQSSLNLTSGSNAQLTAAILPSNATNKNVTWTSSNNAVASVDGTGRVLAVSKGTATITVTTADGSYTATCLVTVDGSGSGSSSSGKYSVNYSSGSTFKSNGIYNKLRSVSVDGRTISTGAYNAYAGSGNYAYVTLSDSFIESLSNGTHTLTFNFTDGSGSTSFAVDRVNKVPTVSRPVVAAPTARPLGNGSSSTSNNTTSKKGNISASDSNKYIIDEKVDEGVVATDIN